LEVERLSVRLDVLAKVGELFRALMDRLVLNHVRSIETIVTEGLRTVFFDLNLTFEAEITQARGRLSIDFYFRQESKRLPIRGRPLESFGGGPGSFASLILRILAMLRLKRWPVLFLDETLSAVSDEYVDATGQFLNRLAATTGISILLVTHKPAFTDHAANAYAASEHVEEDGAVCLRLNRIRGTA
jgi:DNA repair ATPase RecN